MENLLRDPLYYDTFYRTMDLGNETDHYIPTLVQEFNSKQHLERPNFLNSKGSNVKTSSLTFGDIESDRKLSYNMTSDVEYNYRTILNLQPTNHSVSVQNIIDSKTISGQKLSRNFNTPIRDIENPSAWFEGCTPYNESQYLEEKPLEAKKIPESSISAQLTNLNHIFYLNSPTNNSYSSEGEEPYEVLMNTNASESNFYEENNKQYSLPPGNYGEDNILTDSLGHINTQTSHLVADEELLDSSLPDLSLYQDIQDMLFLLEKSEKNPFPPDLGDFQLPLKPIPEGTKVFEYISCTSNEELAPTLEEAVKPLKRGRGRPRKVTATIVAETAPVIKPNCTHSMVEGSCSPDSNRQERKAKLRCQKIIEDIAIKDEPESSYLECTIPYKRIKVQKIDEDDNFDPHLEASDEVNVQERKEMERIKNNIASKKSRDKKREMEIEQENKWSQLVKNHEDLNTMNKRLKEALAIIRNTRV